MLCRLLHKSRMNEVIMSILNVEHLNHGFGDRAILKDVTFRLLKGEHVGFVGANGEGKSTFMNIITGDTLIQPGDHVVVFCLSMMIKKIEKFFN